MKDPVNIGAIVSSIHETCESAVWAGIHDAARAEGVNLITFVAASSDRRETLDVHFPMVRDFANNGRLDGIILSAGYAAEFTGGEYMTAYAEAFGDTPLVTLSFEVPGKSCVIADNRSGIIELITHLVMNHGLSRIVFIQGPKGHPEARERFSAYLEGLAANKLPFDRSLVCEGNFSFESGKAAIAKLLENGVGFDAIIAGDDETAFGAMESLKLRGIHIPTEVAVTGFDDVSEAGVTMPSLTTVRQPLFSIGARAVTTLLAQIMERRRPARIVLPTRAVYRRSCGCFTDYVSVTPTEFTLHPETGREDMIRRIAQLLSGSADISAYTRKADDLTPLAQQIVESFEEDICKYGVHAGFLDTIDMAIFKLERLPDGIAALEEVLRELSRYPGFLFDDPILITNGHHILQLATMLVQESQNNAKRLAAMRDATLHVKVRETCQRIIRTFELDRLLHTLAADLPELGIERFAILLFSGDEAINVDQWRMPDDIRLILARSPETGRLTTREAASPLQDARIIPSEMTLEAGGAHTLFMPLFFKNEVLGYALFGIKDIRLPFIYDDIRLHTSIAIKSALLKQDLEEQSAKDTLTGLLNRRGFMAGCHHLIRTSARAASRLMMMYIDLDGLKDLNDAHGHDAGDRAIRGAAGVLTSVFRRQDVIGRLGGDEFAVLCTMDYPRETEELIVRRLERQTARYNEENRPPVSLSMTFGCAFCDPAQNPLIEDLIRESDVIMMSKKVRRRR